MLTVIVYGPMGCGKTRNFRTLRDKFGCSDVIDDWSCIRNQPLKPGCLHLTNLTENEIKTVLGKVGREGIRLVDLQVIPFDVAMQGVA